MKRSAARETRRLAGSISGRPQLRPLFESLENRQLLTVGNHLYIASTIATTAAGASLGTINVEELNGTGKVVVTDSSSVVQLYIQINPDSAQFLDSTSEAPVLTPITATMHKGVATFSGLSLDRAGIGYALGVQGVNNSALLPATSNAFVIKAGAPTSLGFQVQPTFTDSNTVGDKGQNFTINEYSGNTAVANAWTGVVVDVVDHFGNQVKSGISGGTVTMTASPAGSPADHVVPFNTSATTSVSIDPHTEVATYTNLQWTGNVGQSTPDGFNLGDSEIKVQNAVGIENLLKLGPVGVAGPGIQVGTQITSVNPDGTVNLMPATTAAEPAGTTIFVNSAGSFSLNATTSQTVEYDGKAVVVSAAVSNPFDVAVARRTSLAFVPGFAPSASAGVGTALSTIKVEVLNEFGQVATNDNTDNVVLITGNINGTLTQTVVNGVATFDDLSVASQKTILADGEHAPPLLLNFQFQNQALGTATQALNLTPGPAYSLSVQNLFVGGSANAAVVAGAPITASASPGGAQSAVEVDVVDQSGNIVDTDNSTIVSIGLLPNNGRGPIFVGNSTTIYKPSDPQIPAPTLNLPAVPNSFDFQATAQASHGKVFFTNLYTDFAGSGYILSAGTASFASHSGADTQPFTVTAASGSQLLFANQPSTSNTNSRINFVNPANPLLTGVAGVVTVALDPFGNVATGFSGSVTLGLQNSSNIGGVTTVAASNGFALFQQAFVTQAGTYNLTATTQLASTQTVISNTFQVNAASFPGNPGLTLLKPVPINPKSGQSFNVTVEVRDDENGKDKQPLNAYDKLATISLELRDANGNVLPGGPFLQYPTGVQAKQPIDGNVTFTVQITLPGNTATAYTIVALMDINAQKAKTTATVGNASARVLKARARKSTKSGTVQYGLGSLTRNFNVISSFKSYQKLPPGGRSYPPVVGFDPATVPASGPALQQPNVAKGFHQVPQSTKWWSSLIFPRTYVAASDKRTPQDSEQHQLFAVNADPFTAMVNSNRKLELKGSTETALNLVNVQDASQLTLGLTVAGAGVFANTTITAITNNQITLSKAAKQGFQNEPLTFTDFAGLGLSYLSSSALFVLPSKTFNDPPPPNVPVGQPQAWANPQAPGAENWQYAYSGNGNPREYQDFSVGLQGVHADGKVLSYSDWTATLDWQGLDLNGHAQQLLATMGQGLPFVYFTVPTSTAASGTNIQLVTTPKTNIDSTTNQQVPVPVTVTAYSPSGGKISNGTGPFELEISYSVHDVLDNITQVSSTDSSTNVLTVLDATQLAKGMSVVGDGIMSGTTITGIVDNTHVTVSSNPTTTASGVSLLFNSLAIRNFDNFYGVYLPTGVTWHIGNTDASGNTSFTANLTAKNYFSVATLPGGTMGAFNSAFTTFLPYAYTFVTGSTSSFTFDQPSSKVATTYNLTTKTMQATRGASDTGPLQALNATQYNNLSAGDMQSLKNFNVNGEYSYVSPHGELLLFDGPTFSTQLTYTGTLPSVPPLPNGGGALPDVDGTSIEGTGDAALWNNYLLPVLRSVSSQAQSDGMLVLDNIFPNDNNYLQAQAMYGASQLVPILLEVSQSTDSGLSASDKASAAKYAQLVYDAVKDRMGSWLSVNDDEALQLLYYQPATPQEDNAPAGSQGWQTLVTILSGFLSSETLNDHQLIAGYFIKVAAFLTQYDSTWGETTQPVGNVTENLEGKLGDIVNLMIGDVSNDDRSSTTFPFLRNFDVWDMHSWADGAANSDAGTNLESSSEAMNYDSAVIQWGEATGNQSMQNLGVYLYTTELEGVQTYWFSQKNQTDPFGHPTEVIPPQYLGSASNGTQRTVVTKLNENGGGYVGFIGFQTSRVAGIQFLPLSGSAYYLGQDPSFVNTTYTLAQKGATAAGVIPVQPPTYQSLLLPYLALSDPTQALALFQAASQSGQIAAINPNDLIDNNAFNMHWIEALQAYGQVDSSVTADTISYTVFKQPTTGVRTFVAYNPTAISETVHFKAASGNVLLTENVAPFSTLVSTGSGTNVTTVAQQTTPNLSLTTPQNRLFLTSNEGQPTLTYGETGTDEDAITFDGTKPLTFTMSGLTGTLQSQDAAADFSLWLDPETRDASQGSPSLAVTITYNPGAGQPSVTQEYSLFNMSQNAGYVEYRSAQAGGLTSGSPSKSPPTQFVNGSVTICIVAKANISPTSPVRLRTDAAAQQGRVSYVDLPYNFTTVGVDKKGVPIPVDQLNLGGQILGPPLPDIAGQPPSGS